VILGGGVGGVAAALRLRERFGSEHRVVLIDRDPLHGFQASLLWVATGARRPARIQRRLARLEARGVEVVTGEVTELDKAARRVRAGDFAIEADAIIVSLGAELAPEVIPGLAPAGHDLYTLAGAIGLRDALAGFRGGRVVVLTAAAAYKCPAAPYEAAMLVQAQLKARGVSATVEVRAAESGPMLTAGPEVSAAVRAMVEDRGIAYHPDHQIEAVDPAERTLRFANGVSAPFDLLIYVPPHRCPPLLRQAGLTGPSGWVEVDPATMAAGPAGVFAIGDATAIRIPSGRMLPKAGVFAHRQAEVVADNLADEWSGRTPARRFDGVGACFIEVGGGRAGYGWGDFYAAPAPRMQLRPPSRWGHWGKILFEQRWLWQFR
jgi:sulfide:quinone oxidoreductase